jgi:hypothetical protein
MYKTFLLPLLSFGILVSNANAEIRELGYNDRYFPNGVSIIVKVSGLKPDSYKVIIKDGKLKVSSENLAPNGKNESFNYSTNLPDDIYGENIFHLVDVKNGAIHIGF